MRLVITQDFNENGLAQDMGRPLSASSEPGLEVEIAYVVLREDEGSPEQYLTPIDD